MAGTIPYCGPGPAPDAAWASWNFDPLVVTALTAALAAAAWLSARAATAPERRRAVGAAVAAVLLAVAFVSPLCALASSLFSVRVAHHLLLIAAAAPLLALALPAAPVGRPVVPAGRIGLGAVTILHAAIVWTWHAPVPYAAALSSDALYWLMQATLLGSAVLFWAMVRAAGFGSFGAALALGATTVQMGLLGAIITFAPVPLYAHHLSTTAAWGLSPLADQQLAGLLMWVPGSLPYALAALAGLAGWLAGTPGRDHAA